VIVRRGNITWLDEVWFADPKIKEVLESKSSRSKIWHSLVNGFSSYLLRIKFGRPFLGEGKSAQMCYLKFHGNLEILISGRVLWQ
jgi:hypothetical protein